MQYPFCLEDYDEDSEEEELDDYGHPYTPNDDDYDEMDELETVSLIGGDSPTPPSQDPRKE